MNCITKIPESYMRKKNKGACMKILLPNVLFFDIITAKTTKSFVSINMNRYSYCFELASNKKYVQSGRAGQGFKPEAHWAGMGRAVPSQCVVF
jgi:hypothetical protein